MKQQTQTWVRYSDGRSGIYRIKNRITGAVYIGQSVRVGYRIAQHRKHLRKGTHYNKHLQSSFDKHGEAAFEFALIAVVTGSDALTRSEQAILDMYRRRGFATYNKAAPVNTPLLGAKRPGAGSELRDPSIREKGLVAWRKWAASDEGAAVLRRSGTKAMKRLRADAEIESRRKKAAADAQRRPEVREAARKRMLERQSDPEFKARALAGQAVVAERTKKKVRHKPSGVVYQSMSDAAAAFGCSGATITKYLKGKGKYPPSPDWEYVTND